MVLKIKNYIQCDECNAHLSYNKEDTYISWNWNHKHKFLYVDCPICGNAIAIKEYQTEIRDIRRNV